MYWAPPLWKILGCFLAPSIHSLYFWYVSNFCGCGSTCLGSMQFSLWHMTQVLPIKAPECFVRSDWLRNGNMTQLKQVKLKGFCLSLLDSRASPSQKPGRLELVQPPKLLKSLRIKIWEESKAKFRNREMPAQFLEFSVMWPNKFYFLFKLVELGYMLLNEQTDTGCVRHKKMTKIKKLINYKKIFTKIIIVWGKVFIL